MSIEAMKQALEALEDANEMAYTEFSSENLYGDAITALRQAIADLEKQKPLAKISIEGVLGVHFTDINRACKLPIGTPLYTHPPTREPLTDDEAYPQSVQIDFKQATELLAMFGGEPSEITLSIVDGHEGKGLYAYFTDYPEEGSIYLGVSDEEAEPIEAAHDIKGKS